MKHIIRFPIMLFVLLNLVGLNIYGVGNKDANKIASTNCEIISVYLNEPKSSSPAVVYSAYGWRKVESWFGTVNGKTFNFIEKWFGVAVSKTFNFVESWIATVIGKRFNIVESWTESFSVSIGAQFLTYTRIGLFLTGSILVAIGCLGGIKRHKSLNFIILWAILSFTGIGLLLGGIFI